MTQYTIDGTNLLMCLALDDTPRPANRSPRIICTCKVIPCFIFSLLLSCLFSSVLYDPPICPSHVYYIRDLEIFNEDPTQYGDFFTEIFTGAAIIDI